MGVWLARVGLSAADHSRFYISHVSLNLLGWVGITVLGTLVTLWPTALRTQLHERAEKQARRALPILAGGIAVIQVANRKSTRLNSSHVAISYAVFCLK